MQQVSELRAQCATLFEKYETLWGSFDPDGLKRRLDEIEKQISAPGAWDEPEKLTPALKEKSRLESELERNSALSGAKDNAEEWLMLAEEGENEADRHEAMHSLEEAIGQLGELLEQMEMEMLLGADGDSEDALLEIHPGAGGTEAQDWAEMLLRMYMRWADSHGFKTEYLDYLGGDEAGLKSVTIRVSGPNAHGLLKVEKGIHRLIRISPFDTSGRRHTSFASVDVMPDVGENVKIEVNESDLRIDVFRASGAGGQHVNKTNSAVRITHIPSGIVVQCQNEKSQHHNRDAAMSILKARLYALELKKREALRQADYNDKDAIGFGSQIRTYTMQPYRLVKDHRTNSECTDVDAVLDGKLDTLIRDNLIYEHSTKN
ncbi:peptide chain release factor 2 [Desulfovibrio sp. OttesenSCG-928-C06]|nr:peptide chain release factor 2 [Desulfovibrio sp. OttesenSCG-928-C06]